MVSKKDFLLIVLLIFGGIATGGNASAQGARELAHDMFNSTKKVKTLSYVMTKKERINGEMVHQKSFVKMQRKPLKVYTKQLFPNDGLEVLYKEGDRNALINPSGFPWFNVKLEPTGSRMTRDQHHTILDSGFDCFIDILHHLLVKYDQDLEEMAQVNGKEMINGRESWILEFKNPNFSYIEFWVKEKVSIFDFVDKKKISREMIIRKNPELEGKEYLPEETQITIPNDYSPKMVLYVDVITKTPLRIVVDDEQGLYEFYEFDNVQLNPEFADDEFSSSYAEYDF